MDIGISEPWSLCNNSAMKHLQTHTAKELRRAEAKCSTVQANDFSMESDD